MGQLSVWALRRKQIKYRIRVRPRSPSPSPSSYYLANRIEPSGREIAGELGET